MAEELNEPKESVKPAKVAKAAKPSKVLVVSKFDRFVDQITGMEITKTPVEVEMHPWLQANVDAGLVILC